MRALAVRHVEIEHLGAMERVLKNAGFQFEYLDTAMGQTLTRPLEDYQLIKGKKIGWLEVSRVVSMFTLRVSLNALRCFSGTEVPLTYRKVL